MRRFGAVAFIALSACTATMKTAPERKPPDYIVKSLPKEENHCTVEKRLLREEKQESSICRQNRFFVLTDKKRLVTVYRDSPETGWENVSLQEHTSSTDLSDILVTGNEKWACSSEDVCYFLLHEGKLAVVALDPKKLGLEDDTRIYDLEYDVSEVEIFSFDKDKLVIAPVTNPDGENFMMVLWFSDGVEIKKGEIIPED
ncbi:hypothetical protein JXA56_00450 [Candidatus Micrarchaeota archaeon]|nr:hypothetical protein [Candidatus Micrarchaeota archaeon]